jgi:hypothetical protein
VVWRGTLSFFPLRRDFRQNWEPTKTVGMRAQHSALYEQLSHANPGENRQLWLQHAVVCKDYGAQVAMIHLENGLFLFLMRVYRVCIVSRWQRLQAIVKEVERAYTRC